MMKYLTAFILLLSIADASAQNDSLMPNLSAVYQVNCSTQDGSGFSDYIFSNPNLEYDTVDVHTFNGDLIAKLHYDTLKVWIKRLIDFQDCYVGWSEELTNEWELLYDFGLEVGDSAYSIWGSSGSITSIEEIEVQGQIRKKFNIDDGSWSYIQGIGDVNHPLHPKMYVFENFYEVCTSHLYYSGPSPIDSITFSLNCSGEILSAKQLELADFIVFPNPAGDFVKIKLHEHNQTLDDIIFYDLQGRQIISKSGLGIENEINISNLPRGMYLVRGRSKDGVFSGKVFKE